MAIEKKKSIIEEAMLEAKSLERALKANTKEMLAAHMSKEIESIVESSLKGKKVTSKKSVKEQEEEEIEDDMEMGLDDEEDVDLDSLDDEEGEYELDDQDDEMEDEMGDDLDLGDEMEGDEEMDFDVSFGDETEPDMGFGDEEDKPMQVHDLRGASDQKVKSVFKKLSDNDEVEVVNDDFGLHLKDNETGAEYYIKESMNHKKSMSQKRNFRHLEEDEDESCVECGGGSMYEEDEIMYEIELEDGSDMGDMLSRHMKNDKGLGNQKMRREYDFEEDEEEIVEDKIMRHRQDGEYGGGRQKYVGSRFGAKMYESKTPQTKKVIQNKKPIQKVEQKKTISESEQKLLKEYNILKGKNEEYKQALNLFKDKLNEVALFNTNLAYVNRLFTEHSTSQKEKMEIIKRFDGAESIKESKNIYKSVKSELDRKTPITESIESKVNKSIKSSNATNLNESTAYVDPQIAKIKDLMKRIS